MAKGRITYSGIYLDSAQLFIQRCGEIETVHTNVSEEASRGRSAGRLHQIYAVNAIINSVLYAEATINEFYRRVERDIGAVTGGHRENPPLPPEFYHKLADKRETFEKRRSWYNKYHLILDICPEVEPFDKDSEPYRSIRDLNELRNHFVHYKSEWFDADVGPEPTDLAERLLQRGISTNPLQPDGTAYSEDNILSHDCARWSLDTALNYADEFHERMGIDYR